MKNRIVDKSEEIVEMMTGFLYHILFQEIIFVRCLRPNKFLEAKTFDEDFVEMQLRSCGLAAYKSLMEQGYPARYECDQLLTVYDLLPMVGRFKHLRLEVLLSSIGVNRNDYKLGNTRVCLRPLKSEILNKILHPSKIEIEHVKAEYGKKLAVFRRWSNLVEAVLQNPLIMKKSQ